MKVAWHGAVCARPTCGLLLRIECAVVEVLVLVEPDLSHPSAVAPGHLRGALRPRVRVHLPDLVYVAHPGARHDLHLAAAGPNAQRQLEVLPTPYL